jgi:hypothetical protein
MQRIEEKRIDNSSLVPRRIAEQRTDWRQPKPLGVDLSGLQKGVNALGKLGDFIGNEFEKANREMDELAEIKVNSIVKNAELEAKGKFENFSLTELPNEIPGIRTAFSESVRNQIKDVPMTSIMREKVNAKLSGIDENMKVSMRYELDRKRANYVLNENINIYNDALQQGDTAAALKQREKLMNLGVKIKESEADIKSNGALKALRESFDLNDFENLEKLEAAKDGKYIHFSELRQNERMELIKYGKEKQHKLQNDNYNKYLVKNANGEDFTITDIKDMYAKKGLNDSGYTALIKGKQAQNYSNMLNDIENIDVENADMELSGYALVAQQQFDNGEISEKQFNAVNSALKSANINIVKQKVAQLKQQITANKARNEEIKTGFMGMVLSAQIPLNPTDNAIQKQVVLNQAAKVFGSDLNLLNSVNKEIEKIYADGLKGKGIFETPEGAIVRNYLNSNFRTKDGKFNRDLLKYDPWGPRKYDTQEFMSERYYMLVDHAVFCLKNGMSAPQIREELEKKNKEFGDNETKIILSKIEKRNSFKDKMIISGDKK